MKSLGRRESVSGVAVIGGGPAGLMAAATLRQAGRAVQLFDALPTPGRKFLRAGVGGLNLTHSEPLESFLARYGAARPHLEPILRAWGPAEVRAWAQQLGFETFVGTSGRVFPSGMKASPLLRTWLKQLQETGVRFQGGWRWCGLEKNPSATDSDLLLRFDTPAGEQTLHTEAVILALGGGSWPRLGSTGRWVGILESLGIPIAPLKASNCGFDVTWSEIFKTKFDGAPLKTITATLHGHTTQGEFIITREGVEGSLIYALSAPLREEIESHGQAILLLDLAPDWSATRLTERLSRPRGSRSTSSHLEKATGLKGVKAGLLWEFLPRETFDQPEKLAAAIKALPLPLIRPRPLAEAISSAGGVRFEALTESLMLKTLPGVFCAGEMLDWEAPTGGYLLTACLSTGKWAAHGADAWLRG
jgi:uncharacterized flavoprotein (TIGR03862 family)